MPRNTYKSTPLYGGALVCELPGNFADVSKLRQVPDNQEVYIDKDGFTSIILELTERVEPSESDRGEDSLRLDGLALTTHLEDLVASDIDTVQVWNTSETNFSQLDGDIPAYTLIATQTPKASGGGSELSSGSGGERQRSAAPDFTAIILTLVRLKKQKTDVLITINVPHIKGEYDEEDVDLALGKQGKLIGDAIEHASVIWQTLKVKDWGLFDEI